MCASAGSILELFTTGQATNSSSLQVNMRVKDTDAAESDGGPPDVQRWNQAMNLAANAFLTYSQVFH